MHVHGRARAATAAWVFQLPESVANPEVSRYGIAFHSIKSTTMLQARDNVELKQCPFAANPRIGWIVKWISGELAIQ